MKMRRHRNIHSLIRKRDEKKGFICYECEFINFQPKYKICMKMLVFTSLHICESVVGVWIVINYNRRNYYVFLTSLIFKRKTVNNVNKTIFQCIYRLRVSFFWSKFYQTIWKMVTYFF